MDNEKVLEHLYTLQGLKPPESEEFIERWINDIISDISLDSCRSVGYGNEFETLSKYIKSNTKKCNGFDRILRNDNNFILRLTESYSECTRTIL